ncbi:MAG: hypothetical protein AAGA70_18820 [Pseudomonadota bacterium]
MNEHTELPPPRVADETERENLCKIPQNIRVTKGKPDPLDDEVDKIFIGTDRFIIYSVLQEDPQLDLSQTDQDGEKPDSLATRLRSHLNPRFDHVWLRTQYPEDYECARLLRKKLSGIAAKLAYLCDAVDSLCRSGSLDQGSSHSLRRRATEMMARAMEMAYEGNEDGAKELLANLRKNVTTMRDSKNRMRYVQGNLLALAAILVTWGVLRFAVLPNELTIGDTPGIHALDILALGAIGAFFAVSASVSSIKVDHAVTFWEMVYSGFVRIPIGVIAAGVSIFLISGGWLMASIEQTLLPWTFLLFGFLAGFSELFVPNALKNVEAASTVNSPAQGSGSED